MMKFYMLKDRVPVATTSIMEWSIWLTASENERRVGFTEIEGLEISTVFLAPVDTELLLSRPDMFETMVFKEGTPLNSTKYSTWVDAEIGHNLEVKKIKAEFEVAGQLAGSALTKLMQR